MEINQKFGELATDSIVEKTLAELKNSNIHVEVVNTLSEAKETAIRIIPRGAEVMNMTSVTVDAIGLSDYINNSNEYSSARKKLQAMGNDMVSEKRQLGAAPDWVIGSVHAITEDGQLIIASASGSQLPAYSFGSAHVLFIAGTQKIVANLEEGMKRINEYVFPLEDERAQKAYGMHSGINKILIINKEMTPNRISLVLIKEKVGF